MSTPVDLAAVEKACEAAHQEVIRLCEPGANWRMSIPADMRRDSDLIITEALTGAEHQARAIRNVLHEHHRIDDWRWPECLQCRRSWPCPTIAAISRHVAVG